MNIKWYSATITMILFALSLNSEALTPSQNLDERVGNVENGVIQLNSEGVPQWDEPKTVIERMEYYRVPGLSIAVINDLKIEWAKGYGVLEAGGTASVTPKTLFQTASIGKTVTALTALHYVEKGRLNLDEDVNERLVTWKIPENPFTETQKVTLRRLMTHTAGVTVGGFSGYKKGEAIPSRLQLLNGEPPANNVPLRVDRIPGSEWRYSGGGFVLIEQLLEEVSQQPFSEVVRHAVFEPVGMTSSFYSVILPEEAEKRAATAHNGSGEPVSGKWHAFRCMGAGGSLWSTPSDLARFAIEVMNAKRGSASRVISQNMAGEMLRVQMDQGNFDYFSAQGLGFVLDLRLPGVMLKTNFGHGGHNPPGYWGLMVVFPELGDGAVLMANGENGVAVITEVLLGMAREYGWIVD